MSGYCPDCGNTLCLCEDIAEEKYRKVMVPKDIYRHFLGGANIVGILRKVKEIEEDRSRLEKQVEVLLEAVGEEIKKVLDNAFDDYKHVVEGKIRNIRKEALKKLKEIDNE